jgi:4-hydroxybenzoate polyprenyltransferase
MPKTTYPGEAQAPPSVAASRPNRLFACLRIMRPQQWVKNVLVLAAFLFAGPLSAPAHLLHASQLFAVFCLVSSGIYIINDLADRKTDRIHPRKRNRPIASGLVGPRLAAAVAALLFVAGFFIASKLPLSAIACVLSYAILQIFYTFLLKHIVILDILAIAAGFVLRAVSGAFAIKVVISPWLYICTIVLALFLALGKRRSELMVSNNASSHRRVLEYYNVDLLNQLIAVVTSCTLLAYILYTFSEQTMQKFPSHLMPLTLPFVMYGIFRYLYLIYGKHQGEEPETLLMKDFPLLLDIALWGIAVAIIVSLD